MIVNGVKTYLPYYPLYEIGTKVKVDVWKNFGKEGVIYMTYRNHDPFEKNDDKYGVKFSDGGTEFYRINELKVENPNREKFAGTIVGELVKRDEEREEMLD